MSDDSTTTTPDPAIVRAAARALQVAAARAEGARARALLEGAEEIERAEVGEDAAARATGLTTEPSESEDGRSMRRFA